MAAKLPKSKPVKAPAIVSKWKRILAVGCSHGIHADKQALRAVLEFRERWKPDAVFHMGDFLDTAALRSGAPNTADESEPVQPDIDHGLGFIEQLRPTHILCGNHEDRAWKLRNHHNAVVSYCAQAIVTAIEETAAKIGAKVFPYDGIWQQVKLGGYTYTHGTMYGENATRDHAEAFGNVVHAHTHRPGFAAARRSDHALGYCVGALAEPRSLDYAKARRATLAWGRGFVWGEYTDAASVLWVHSQPNDQPWRFPA